MRAQVHHPSDRDPKTRGKENLFLIRIMDGDVESGVLTVLSAGWLETVGSARSTRLYQYLALTKGQKFFFFYFILSIMLVSITND